MPNDAAEILGQDLALELRHVLRDHVEVVQALVRGLDEAWTVVELVIVLGISLTNAEPPSAEPVLSRLCDALHPRLRAYAPQCAGIRFVSDGIDASWPRAIPVFAAAGARGPTPG
jgi:hypothetical protein